MPPVASAPKNPAHVAAGRRAAGARWAGHDTTIVRLDSLAEPERRLIMALIRQRKEAALIGDTRPASDEEPER